MRSSDHAVCRGRPAAAGWVLSLVCAVTAAAVAEPVGSGSIESSRWSVGLDGERWQLPADETAGLVGLHLRRQLNDILSVGVDSFAAVQGRRGGFITLGVGGDARFPIGRWIDLELGASVSAGGGRGGHELSGGGLLLRESLGVGIPSGALRWRAGISRVDFPNGGTIHSTEGYLGIERAFSSVTAPANTGGGRFVLPDAMEFDRTDVGLFVRQYRVRAGSLTDTGAPQTAFGLVGAEWRGHLAGPWYAMLDAGGAAHGQSNGYMQILGGVGLRWPLGTSWSVDAGIAAGAGGGGAVQTGGGFLAAARVGAEWRVTRDDAVTIGVERLTAPGGTLTADGVSVGLRHRFGPDEPIVADAAASADLDAHPVRVRVLEQSYRAARVDWATRPLPGIGVLGVAADYDLTAHWYLTGQGLAAYRGQSGAYMAGLVGLGVHAPLWGRWQLEGEALAGAAGGGGVAVASGAVGQANAGLGYETARGLGLHVSVGQLRALHGPFAATVIGLSFSARTTLLSGRR